MLGAFQRKVNWGKDIDDFVFFDVMAPEVHFSRIEIDLARKMRSAGLSWQPSPGQFVLDEQRIVDRESPFQDGVFFILNFDYFMKIAGGEERFVKIMTWLPVWEDCRRILAYLQVSNADVARRISDRHAIEDGIERLCLYELILERMRDQA